MAEEPVDASNPGFFILSKSFLRTGLPYPSFAGPSPAGFSAGFSSITFLKCN
jgi:hypothetical protein